MSATRLLVLGVVRGYGRAHGYLVRSLLVSWGAEQWANVKWGSIYHALRQLAKEGRMQVSTIEKWPGRTDYQLTEQGEQEFFELLRDALKRPEHRPDMLAAGLALLPALPRDEAIELLTERLATLESERDQWAEYVDRGVPDAPAHIGELFGLGWRLAAGGAEWTQGLIDRLRAGQYPMAGENTPGSYGEPGSWPRLGAG